MKKKVYTKPQSQTINLRGPIVMVDASVNSVRDYNNGSNVNIGDEDE